MNYLSRLHAHLRNARMTHRGATQKPEDVPRGLHKEYARMERISLPRYKVSYDLQFALEKRSSANAGDPKKPIRLSDLSALLGLSLKKRDGVVNRNYPSGGALYPIETYLVSTAIEGGFPAVFHYHPTEHALEKLWGLPDDFNMRSIASQSGLLLSTLIIFTSIWERSSAKYGDLAYQHALIEAGHMGQNVLLSATALGLNARPYAGFDDKKIAELLDLREDLEQPAHSIALCAN